MLDRDVACVAGRQRRGFRQHRAKIVCDVAIGAHAFMLRAGGSRVEGGSRVKTSAEGGWTEVLCYKFIAPAPYAGAIRREGILRRIARNPAANVILLQGPAGHGKSTALQQLKDAAEADGRLTGWLTFDSGDNDPRRCCMHFQSLVAALLMQAGDLSSDGGERRNSKYYT